MVETWERGRLWLRCHNAEFGATEFNPGLGRGRFHPFVSEEGSPVPTLYGANTLEGALSETIFHSVPVRAPVRGIRFSSLRPMVVSTLVARRDLSLIQLHGFGLSRLGVSRGELLDCEAGAYAATAVWAQALHRSAVRPDGLVWVSRLHDTAFALVLFGDRVRRSDLTVAQAPLPLSHGAGLMAVQRAAEQSGITILRAE